MGSGHDPVSGNDGSTAHVETRLGLDGHLPRDLTVDGFRASNNSATNGGEVPHGATGLHGGG